MRHVLLLIACLVLPSLALSAPADSTSAANTPRNSLRGGAWALQFDINGQLLSIDSFAGGLSLKRHFSPRSALRFGVGVSAASRDLNTETGIAREVNENSAGTFLEVAYQRYTNPDAVVHLYWTVGPRVSYSNVTNESTTESLYRREEDKQWAVEGIASLGTEWFLARQFSFHGEFFARGGYVSEKQTFESKTTGQPSNKATQENTGWSGGISNSVRLGMSVYF
jgi:hypothetical protein